MRHNPLLQLTATPPAKLARLDSMQFGNRSTFAIDCVHEPIANEKGWVFGRMCI
ncbi:Uncharacterised protein [Xylophilus ampelinus]|nr:Uncharacterised protein [Xylophilus ampelinus]